MVCALSMFCFLRFTSTVLLISKTSRPQYERALARRLALIRRHRLIIIHFSLRCWTAPLRPCTFRWPDVASGRSAFDTEFGEGQVCREFIIESLVLRLVLSSFTLSNNPLSTASIASESLRTTRHAWLPQQRPARALLHRRHCSYQQF